MRNKIKTSKSYKTFTIFNTLLLILLSLITFYPILHVIMGSISDGIALTTHRGLLFWPKGRINIDAYTAVLKNPNIITGYRNTIIILVSGTFFQVFMTALGGYVLSRKNALWISVIMMAIVFTMFFEGGLIPFYFVVRGLGLSNTLLALILPFSVNAYNLIIMRTSFAAIPLSLEESAKLDGAHHWTIFTRIFLPLSKPVIAVMVLYYGVGIWNGWFWASIFIRNRELFPLQLILREILVANDTSSMTTGSSGMDKVTIAETIKYATIVVSTIPILIVYPFLQKYFVKGVMVGAVKG